MTPDLPFTTDCEQRVLPFFEGQVPLAPVSEALHTPEVARKVARVAITEAASRLSHLEDLLIWDSAFDANQWDAAETLLLEALREVRKGRSASNLIAAQKAAQAQRDTQAVVMRLERMGMSEVHPFLDDALGMVRP